MITITYKLDNATQLATALLPHIPKNDSIPVLEHARIDATTNTAWATDRYTIGMFETTAETYEGEEGLISREALEYIAKIQPRKLRRTTGQYFVQLKLTEEEDLVQLSWKEKPQDPKTVAAVEELKTFSKNSSIKKHNYPPIHRLYHEWKPATDSGNQHYTIALTPENISKMFPYANKYAKHSPIRYTYPELTATGKPNAIKAEIKVDGNRYTSLIQPNLMVE